MLALGGGRRKLDIRSAFISGSQPNQVSEGQHAGQSGAPFLLVKRQFGYVKARYRGLKKNTAPPVALFALSHL
jgi:IS5 family transposase